MCGLGAFFGKIPACPQCQDWSRSWCFHPISPGMQLDPAMHIQQSKQPQANGLLLTTCRFSKPKLNINVCFGGMFTIVVLLNKYMQFSHDYWSQESDPLKCSVMYGTQVVTTPGIRHSVVRALSKQVVSTPELRPSRDLSSDQRWCHQTSAKNNSDPDGGLIIVCILGLVW